MSSANLLAEYNASRDPGTDVSVLCHAPFISLNFDQTGRATACCFNRHFILGRYPEQSVREIWTGAPAQALREAFLTGANAPGCDRCFGQLEHRNFSGALMRNFDRYTARGAFRPRNSDGMPLILEFEISNTCNLECVMCAGNWSSTIRARREKLPPLPDPYDRQFVDQIEEFVPTLAGAKFLGGEPFIINRYHEIWDSIRRLNPNALLSITTSGATLPERSRAMLEHLRSDIIVSLDGITRPTYELIRVNARFDDVMENITYFRSYTRRRGTSLTAAICPMTHNWRELRALVDFCEEREMFVYFNTVTHPIGSTLAGLSEAELTEVVECLDAEGRAAADRWTAASRRVWQSMTSQLRSWLDEKRSFSRECQDVAAGARAFVAAHLGGDPDRASTERIEPLIDPLVFAVEAARARDLADAGEGRRARFLLPHHPLTLWREDEPPATRELLLAAHLICRFATDRDAATPTAGGDSLLDEHRLLRLYLDSLLNSAERWPELNRLGRAVRERLRYRKPQAAFDIVEELLVDAERMGSAPDPGELRRQFDSECDGLEAEGFDEYERARIRGYAHRLVSSHVRPRFVRADDSGSGAQIESVSRIEDDRDMRAFLRAALMFHLGVSRAATHDTFRRRLDVVRELLSRDPHGAVMSALRKPDVTYVYAFWSIASDEEFADAMTSVS